MKNIFKISSIVTILGFVALNAYIARDNSIYNGIDLVSLFSLSEVKAENTKVYKWSNLIDCPGLGNGDYQVCQENGYQNVCSSPGSVTCDCGSPTNWNKDGNCQ